MDSVNYGDANSGFQIGANNGPINAQFFSRPLTQPETPPSPLSTVPFRRDPDFTDCGFIESQIDEKASVPGSRVALIGLGGIGKSQLAIEYAYRVRNRSPTTWVLWFHASNATRFEQSCREIADRVRIPGRRERDANIFELLQDWLHNKKEGEWLLIIDNLDDDDFLHQRPPARQGTSESAPSGTPERTIWDYFHRSLRGSIIVTSRSRQAVSNIVEDMDVVVIEHLYRDHAFMLLKRRLGWDAEFPEDEAEKLTEALGFMPLAIVQAATFIKQRAPRMSLSQYLEVFERSDQDKVSLLRHEAGNHRRDQEATNSILHTLQVSLDQLHQKRASAVGLLAQMSFFENHDIPEVGLCDQGEANDKSPVDAPEAMRYDVARNSNLGFIDFEDDILALRDYSLIRSREGLQGFSMPPLVQLAVQDWLKAKQQLEIQRGYFSRRLASIFPAADSQAENWKLCQTLYPHVKYAIRQIPLDSAPGWGSLLERATKFALDIEDIRGNMDMGVIAFNTMQEKHGSRDKRTIGCVAWLGSASFNAGHWNEAEVLHKYALCAREQAPEKEKNDVPILHSRIGLMSTLYFQHRWQEAERLGVKARNYALRQFDADDPRYLLVTSILALIYKGMGRASEAEDLELLAVGIAKQVHGADNRGTLMCMAELASTYCYQKQFKAALDLQEQALECFQQTLGPEHHHTLESMAALGFIYWSQGQLKKAERLYTKVVNIRTRIRGWNDCATLVSCADLSSVHYSQGQLRKAGDSQWTIVTCLKEQLGKEHPYTLSTMSDLELSYRGQGRLEEAENIAHEIDETCKQKPEREVSDALASLSIRATRGSRPGDSIDNPSGSATSEQETPQARHDRLAMTARIYRRIRAYLDFCGNVHCK